MTELIPLAPWLIAMVILMACSGFFSASEAALFLEFGHQHHLFCHQFDLFTAD